MCKIVECPNHPAEQKMFTWWGCGKHIEQALADTPPDHRCDCEHEPVPMTGGMLLRPKMKVQGEGDEGDK